MEAQSTSSGQHKQICAGEDYNRGRPSTEEIASSGKSLGITTAVNPDISQKRLANDKQKLLKIFPPELWPLIFEKLEHFDDREKVRNCSLFFRELLLCERVKLLFDNVWEILSCSRHYNNGARNVNEFHSLQNYSSFPESEEKKTFKKEELKLRLVCHSWSHAIDKFHERGAIYFWLWHFKKLINLLQNFEATHGLSTTRNPFIGRSAFVVRGVGECNKFVNLVYSILDKYGHHFWHCIVAIEASITQGYLQLRAILQRMPNVKTIEVLYCNGSGGCRQLAAGELQEFETVATANPFPFLKELQEVKLNNLPEQILQQFIRTNPHVSNIKITAVPCAIESFWSRAPDTDT